MGIVCFTLGFLRLVFCRWPFGVDFGDGLLVFVFMRCVSCFWRCVFDVGVGRLALGIVCFTVGFLRVVFCR